MNKQIENCKYCNKLPKNFNNLYYCSCKAKPGALILGISRRKWNKENDNVN